MERKGIIMKIAGQQVIVLTSDRQFITLPYEAHMRVGKEVIIPIVTQTEKRSFFRSPIKIIGVFVASVLMVLEFWQGIPKHQGNHAYAYITIDVNPSVELAIDRQELVLFANPLNDDAKKLLENTQLTGKQVDQAVAVLADESVRQGYLKAQSEVLISASRVQGEDERTIDLTQLEDKLMNAFHHAVSQNIPVDVEGVIVSDELRHEAMSQGLSAGKYYLYETARSLGVPVTIDELRHESITEVANRYGLDLSRILHQLRDVNHTSRVTNHEEHVLDDTVSESGNLKGNKSKQILDDGQPASSAQPSSQLPFIGKIEREERQVQGREESKKSLDMDPPHSFQVHPPFHRNRENDEDKVKKHDEEKKNDKGDEGDREKRHDKKH
ncbi:hypothetical protein DNHGIG_27630 [Collibacillus ludicampi]|uniref:RsgI N-terminal anti-sigma domain-containing protein n=1 Tax=Collibacillus ludicampi TaxID=2771369 RepID=A0AAV4LIC3_9BACL|nr:anti-sigma factor domain-containing protein [Collibacillus ludicampi]GIM47214.1 hypothetical protein DNHGIG_27630 [Collibacillus ludicampi]